MEKHIVHGMTCAVCQAHVEKAVRGLQGVRDVQVSLLTNSMTVEGDAPVAAVLQAVEKAGYEAEWQTKPSNPIGERPVPTGGSRTFSPQGAGKAEKGEEISFYEPL